MDIMLPEIVNENYLQPFYLEGLKNTCIYNE
jgi:hypothetical protein